MCCFVVVVQMAASFARFVEFQTRAARTCDRCRYSCPYSRHSRRLASPRPTAAYSTAELSRSGFQSVRLSRGTSEPPASCAQLCASIRKGSGLQKLCGSSDRSSSGGARGFASLRGVSPRKCTFCCGSSHFVVS